jgi:hypothetical protein
MKKLISIAMALVLTMAVVVPAMAADTFQAFSQMSATDRAVLTPLDDDQMAAVEGARRVSLQRHNPVNIVLQLAIVNQTNICVVCAGVSQSNAASTSQGVRRP